MSRLRVAIEVPRGSFVKRDGRGRIAFLSPLPCPFNYGSVPGLTAGDGEWRDAVVLGPRLGRGTRIEVPVRGVIAFIDAGREDFKLNLQFEAPFGSGSKAGAAVFRFLCRLQAVAQPPAGPFARCTVSLGWCAWPDAKRISPPRKFLP